MGLKLTIDEGNSATKTAVWDGDTMSLTETPLDGDGRQFDSGILCSVVAGRGNRAEELSRLCRRFYVLDAFTPMPLHIGYDTPATLGADRIAAAAGALEQAAGRWALVVDMGTAITYDIVSPESRYIGGNIAPGLVVRARALEHFTSALPMVEPRGEVPLWGHDTETAIRAGVVRGVIAELEYYRRRLPGDAVTIITGGTAGIVLDNIAPSDRGGIIVEPNLVHIGLKRILDYNESK